MGGPVYITICKRCGIELEHSETANRYNEELRHYRRDQEWRQELERQTVVVTPPQKSWWQFWRKSGA